VKETGCVLPQTQNVVFERDEIERLVDSIIESEEARGEGTASMKRRKKEKNSVIGQGFGE